MGNIFKTEVPGSPRLEAVLERLDRLVDWERRDRSTGPAGRMRQSIDPTRDLLERLGSPERSWKSVHVAGTKGKGSVASLIAAGLRGWGADEGVYASPHVERVQERVKIRGAEVESDQLAAALERTLDAREQAVAEDTAAREATWFDVLTGAALVVLTEAGVEWAVLECGLGGRLDSTNAVASTLAVLTSVDLEHTAILGATRGHHPFTPPGKYFDLYHPDEIPLPDTFDDAHERSMHHFCRMLEHRGSQSMMMQSFAPTEM